MPDDNALISKILAGDRDSFNELVQKYQREIYLLAYKMVHNREDAEELAQQAFVKAFQKLDSFQGRSSFKTWLYTIAINVCRSFLRRSKNVVELKEEIVQLETAPADTPLSDLLKKESAGEAIKSLKELPEKQRIVVALRIYKEMTYKEIGKIADCSEQTAKVNFHYGVENLRKKLKTSGEL